MGGSVARLVEENEAGIGMRCWTRWVDGWVGGWEDVPRAVRQQPHMRGRPKRSWRAMAEPITSARSQAAMAICGSG